MAIQRRARGVRIPTPGGTVIGRLKGQGDAQPINIADLARQIQSTGVVGGGGSAPGSFTAGSGISITGTWPSLTFSNTGVLSAIAGSGIGVSGATGNVTFSNSGVLSVTAPAAGFAVSASTGAVTFSLNHDLAALEALSSTGLAARTASDTWAQRTITGTSGTITVTNGDGVAGNPTLTIDATYVGQTSITTLGTIGTGTWAGTTIAVNHGGTGQTSYTDGQLLIGNTTGNTLGKATLTAGANITITNGASSITIAAPLAGSGNYLGRRILAGSGTYTPTTGTTQIVLKMVGGGGAGGGVPATSSTQQSEGSGGGAGAVIETYLTSGFSGVSYGVGAAGVGASGAAGGNGGDTTFGTRTAGGGTGGAAGLLTNVAVAGSLGGVVSGNVAGDIAFAGMRGWYSSPILNGGDAVSGRGADAPLGYGFGGSETLGSAAGVSATGLGAGGGGAANLASQSARTGGQAAAGTIIIDEYGPSGATSGVLAGLTTGKVPYATSSSALGDSEITDTGGTGGVYIGSATGSQKGSGTLNAQGLYINGVAVTAGRGLFTEVMSVLPTKSGTGLNTTLNAGAGGFTATDIATGICLDDPETAVVTNTLRGIYKTAPGTPYTITALILYEGWYANFTGCGIGWYDDVNTKAHTMGLIYNTGLQLSVSRWTTLTNISTNDALTNGGLLAHWRWLRISNDGTTITFSSSMNGAQFKTHYSVALASSHLGSGNYKKILFWVNPNGNYAIGSMLSYTEA